jgi:thioredoxin 1
VQVFDALRKENPVVVVDFYTTFCPSCSVLLPTYEAVARELGDKVVCVKINAEDVPELSKRYKISSVPSLFLFKNGELLDQAVGALPENELKEFIQQAL